MKSFRYNQTDFSLKLVDLPVPKPGPGQALIAVKAAGLCYSDMHFLEGRGTAMLPPHPITLGHEVAGTIVKLGSEPSPFHVGDRVAVALVAHPVDRTDRKTTIGMGYDGGYSEYALGHYEHLVRIPESVPFPQAAVATDSISTAYHATVVTGGVISSTTVAVIGIGGLGLNAVAIAALKGAKVYGVDINEGKFDDAKRLGAVACATSLSSFHDVVFDVIIDFVGSTPTVTAALVSIRKAGTVVVVGLDDNNLNVPSLLLVSKSITLKGSFGSAKEELTKVLDLIATGKISPKVTEIPFEQVSKGLLDLKEKKVDGRLYVCPTQSTTS